MSGAESPPRISVRRSPRVERRFGRAPHRQYDDFRHFVETAAAKGGERIAFRWRPEGSEAERFVSYAELGRLTDRLGAWLLGLGLARGDPIALISENRPEWCIVYLAILAAGLVVVPLDPGLDEAGVVRNIEASSSRLLFLSSKIRSRFPGLSGLGLRCLVDFDAEEDAAELPVLSWSRLLAEEPAPDLSRLPLAGAIGGDARAVVFFTSGTTGVAKGISLSHRALISNVDAARAALDVDERDVFIALLPLHHTYATTCSFLSAVETTCICVIVDRVAPSAVLRALREGGVSFLIGVPLLFDKVRGGIENGIGKLSMPIRSALRVGLALSRFCALKLHLPLGRVLFRSLRERAGLGTVRLAVSGGGPLAPATANFYDALGIDLVQGYGMSENGPLISVNLPGYKDNRSVGFPVRNTEARIEDPGPDGVGEIQVRSPSLMEGYLDAPEETRRAFTEDGWLRTGDLGRSDRRGFLYITGRRKSLIVTEGGKNVYPEEIEGRFQGSPWVKEVLILGRRARSGRPGEEILAVCVPDYEGIEAAHPGRSGDRTFLLSLVRGEVLRVGKGLPPYMKIADFIIREEPFEKTSSQKIRRFLYRKYAESPGT